MNIIIKSTRKTILILAAALMLYSCEKELAVAPPLTYDGEATWTIRDLLNCDTASQLPDSVITGIVVSSDEKGSFYKSLVIQDETGGIQIKVDNSSLFSRYKIGQRVYVKCKDLVLGKYYNLPQMGIGEVTDLIAIPSKYEFQHIYRDGVPETEPAPFEITSATTEDELNAHLNMLVEIPNCQFVQKGVPFVDPLNTRPYTSRDINLRIGSNNLTVNTSKYVDDEIGKTLTPDGTGTVRGILTIYQTYSSPVYQIVLRSIKDIDFVWTEKVYDLADHLSQSMFGWSAKNSGASWTTVTSQSAFMIEGTGTESNSWLISPALNFTGYTRADVSFDRLILGNNDLTMYYTTTAYTPGSDIVTANWTAVTMTPYSATNWDSETVNIPTTAKAIAFKYSGTDSDVYLRKIIINAQKSN